MRRRSSRRRPSGYKRRVEYGQYGIVLVVCLAGLFFLFVIYAIFKGLGSTQLPRGLR